MENLNLKERTAIELRYLGNTYKDIADKTEISENTIQGWFADVDGKGKLLPYYRSYVEKMNRERQKNFEKEIALTDEEILILGTNIVRKLAQRVQQKDFEMTSTDVSAFREIWKIQRIMRGLPVNVETQDVTTHTEINTDEVMEALGLTGKDFIDENYGKTLKKISEYLREKGIK